MMKSPSFNTLDFSPEFSINLSDSYKSDSSATAAGDPARTLVNRSISDYNNDGKYAVTTAKLSEMTELGFREDELEKLSDMEVDEIGTTDFVGCYVMRIA